MFMLRPVFFLVFCLLFAKLSFSGEVTAKMRQPHWSSKVIETYPNSSPKKVVFYDREPDQVVKQILLYPNGQVKTETDLSVIVNGEETKAVPDGVCLFFTDEGKLEKQMFYDRGVLHGEMKLFFPDGTIQGTCGFKQGQRDGIMISYHPNGKKAEEAFYKDGKIINEVTKYHEKGNRSAVIPYEEGVPHGCAIEWYPTGRKKTVIQYKNGSLHSNSKDPAVIAYTKDEMIQEVQDFFEGKLVGLHVKYHANGQESYKVAYKEGLKEGKERFFSTEGKLLGEGDYRQGKPVGKHWRKAENGVQILAAHFDEQGNTIEPIIEYNEEGQKIARYFLLDDKNHGEYLQWYDNGNPKVEYNYDQGQFHGEQKEYYPSGQIKLKAMYVQNNKEGLYEEWYENGKIAQRAIFKNQGLDGVYEQWYENGQLKTQEHHVMGKLDQEQKHWYENGDLKISIRFDLGKKQGLYQEWNDKKELIVSANYDQDRLVGVVKAWWNKNLFREITHYDEKGKLNGLHKEYYPNGQQKALLSYSDDLLDGTVKTWYEDGSPCAIKIFKQGLPVGEHKEYYSSKQLQEKDAFNEGKKTLQMAQHLFFDEQGKMHGEQRVYHQNGALCSSVHYEHGQMHGNKAIWDVDGILVEEASYVQGKLNGRFFEKLPDGREVIYHYKDNQRNGIHEVYYPSNEYFAKTKAFESFFVNDQLEKEVIEYNETGAKVGITPYLHGMKEGVAKIFSPEGQLLVAVNFHQDRKEGTCTQYYPNEKPFVETPYQQDKREGLEKTYYLNGELAKLVTYQNDLINGLYQEWNEAGALVFEAEYQEGKRHGKFNKFYDDGSPYISQTFVEDELHGIKKKYEKDGKIIESFYEKGKKL